MKFNSYFKSGTRNQEEEPLHHHDGALQEGEVHQGADPTVRKDCKNIIIL